MDWRERAIKEIEEFVKDRKKYLDSEVKCIKEEIDKIVQKYLETLKEIPELPKLIDKDIVFVKTLDIGEIANSTVVSGATVLSIDVDGWNHKITVRVKGREYTVPLEDGLKMKLVFYK